MIRFHPHARTLLSERGVTEAEVLATMEEGETFPAKFGRIGFRRNFVFNGVWLEQYYPTKQVEVYAVQDKQDLLVITVIARYY